VLTLSAHKPDAIVLRTPWAGAAELVSIVVLRAIVNAGEWQARASNPGAARRIHVAEALGGIDGASDLDRRRCRAFARRALEHHRVSEAGAKVTVAGRRR